jgi:hypothetical protein
MPTPAPPKALLGPGDKHATAPVTGKAFVVPTETMINVSP